jgi:hypothetical protein
MNLSYKHTMFSCLVFIHLSASAMEETSITVPVPYYGQFKTILTSHYPLAKAVPYIKQLQNQDPTWKDILKDKRACDKLLEFTKVLQLSPAPRITNAIFIGTPGMIECAKECIKSDRSAEELLNNMLVDTGSWINTGWESQATDVARAIIQATGNPDARDKNNETALTSAARNGNFATIKTLLIAGANPRVQNGYGKTALIIIKEMLATVDKEMLATIDTYKTIAVLLTIAEKLHAQEEK